MNLKTTPLLFGVLLGILWLFGLMLVYKKGVVDENLIVPTMQGDVKVDTIRIQYKDKKPDDEVVFQQVDDHWYLKQHGQQVRVEDFRINDLVRQIKDAKRYEEERVQNDTKFYSLPPSGESQMTVTLKGTSKGREREWTFFTGKVGTNDFLVYVNSSDRTDRAFPVLRSSIDALFFKDTAELRSKRLFDLVAETVTLVDLTIARDELELKKIDNTWRFIKPPLGFAGFQTADVPPPPPGADDLQKKEKEKESNNVKALVEAITRIHVDNEKDFVPLGEDLDRFGLKEGSETMRIALGSGTEKTDKDKDKDKKEDGKAEKKEKEGTREVLLVGKRIPGDALKKTEDQYYARLKTDDGVFKINARLLDPLKDAVANPKRLRSNDVVAYDTKNVDAVVIATTRTEKDDKGKDRSVKEEVKLLHPEDKDWQVVTAGDKLRKGNDKAIASLIDQLQGKNEIKEFADGKDDSWVGPTSAEISVYVNGLEKEKDKKKDDKDKKKDDKQQDKDKTKDEKKDDKDAAAAFKPDVKPFVKLIIGTVDKDKKIAHVKRVLQDGTETRFTVPSAYVERLHLDEGALAYVDPLLPAVKIFEVTALDVQRGKDKVELDRVKFNRWLLKDIHDPLGGKLAEAGKVMDLAQKLGKLQVSKWVKKDDLEKLGLKEPQAEVTIYTKAEDRLTAKGAAAWLGYVLSPTPERVLNALGALVAIRQADRGDAATIKFGKEIEQDKTKLVYAEYSGMDLPFLVPADLVKSIRDIDLRDRSAVTHTSAQIDATLMGLTAGEPMNATLLASPLVSGVIHGFDPAKAQEVNVTVRNKIELRSFTFRSHGKDKDRTWLDGSGLKDFQLDTDKVVQLVDHFCKLKTDRFASLGGPTGDYKLTDKEATLRIEITFEDKSTITLRAGTTYGQLGYFANSSYWPEAVFFVPASSVDPLTQGASYFGKERVASGL